MSLYIVKAGIATSANPDQLLIALEPEAASIHTRRLRMRQLVPEKPLRRPLSFRLDNDVDALGGGQQAQQVTAKFTQRKSCICNERRITQICCDVILAQALGWSPAHQISWVSDLLSTRFFSVG